MESREYRRMRAANPHRFADGVGCQLFDLRGISRKRCYLNTADDQTDYHDNRNQRDAAWAPGDFPGLARETFALGLLAVQLLLLFALLQKRLFARALLLLATRALALLALLFRLLLALLLVLGALLLVLLLTPDTVFARALLGFAAGALGRVG